MFELINIKLDRIEKKLDRVLLKENMIYQKENALMTTAADIVAKITAQTTMLQAIKVAEDGLTEGHTTIAEEIQALKDQIAAGQTPDFTAVEAALDEQGTVISSIATAIPANV